MPTYVCVFFTLLIYLVGIKTQEKSYITGHGKCNFVSLRDHKNVLAGSRSAQDILLKASLAPRP